MCFSAWASFGASAVLSIIGIVAIKKTHMTAQIVLTGIPLVFAVQRAAEGCVWLALINLAYTVWLNRQLMCSWHLHKWCGHPGGPLSVLLLEKEAKTKRWLTPACASGLLVSFYLTYRLFTLGACNSALHHLAILYFIVGSPFLSGVAKMRIFGCAITIAYLITILFFKEYELSIWVLFAAITSVIVFSILFELKRNWLIHTRLLRIRR